MARACMVGLSIYVAIAIQRMHAQNLHAVQPCNYYMYIHARVHARTKFTDFIIMCMQNITFTSQIARRKNGVGCTHTHLWLMCTLSANWVLKINSIKNSVYPRFASFVHTAFCVFNTWRRHWNCWFINKSWSLVSTLAIVEDTAVCKWSLNSSMLFHLM